MQTIEGSVKLRDGSAPKRSYLFMHNVKKVIANTNEIKNYTTRFKTY